MYPSLLKEICEKQWGASSKTNGHNGEAGQHSVNFVERFYYTTPIWIELKHFNLVITPQNRVTV
jgi:hypothetical protein